MSPRSMLAWVVGLACLFYGTLTILRYVPGRHLAEVPSHREEEAASLATGMHNGSPRSTTPSSAKVGSLSQAISVLATAASVPAPTGNVVGLTPLQAIAASSEQAQASAGISVREAARDYLYRRIRSRCWAGGLPGQARGNGAFAKVTVTVEVSSGKMRLSGAELHDVEGDATADAVDCALRAIQVPISLPIPAKIAQLLPEGLGSRETFPMMIVRREAPASIGISPAQVPPAPF